MTPDFVAVAITRQPTRVAELRRTLSGYADVVPVATVEEARGRLAALPNAFLIVDASAVHPREGALLVQATVLDSRPIGVVVLADRDAGWNHAVLALVRAGAHVVTNASDTAIMPVIRAALDSARQATLPEIALPQLCEFLRPEILPFVEYCLHNAARPLSVRQVADALGIHRKTLWARCRSAHVPSPLTLLNWCRVLAVAHALDGPRRAVDRIADELEFPTPSALRNLIRSYLGCTPTALQRSGALRIALDMLRSGVLAAQARVADRRAGG